MSGATEKALEGRGRVGPSGAPKKREGAGMADGEGGSKGGGQGESGASVTCRFQVPWLESVPIAVSNNIDEKELARLSQKVEWKGDRRRAV